MILRPIYFEGEKLPTFAITLDVAANPSVTAGVSEELEEWFWRFTICVGAPRSEKSEVVIKHAGDLHGKLERQREDVLPKLIPRFPGRDPSQVFQSWVDSLEVVLKISKGYSVCHWHAEPADKDLPVVEVGRRVLKAIGKENCHTKKQGPP